MPSLTPFFGSSDLTNYFSTFSEAVTNRFNENNVPQRDGTVIQGTTLGRKLINMSGRLFGTDHEALRNLVNSFSADLQSKGLARFQLYDDKYIEARLESLSVDIDGRTGLAVANLSAAFRADNSPYWRGATEVNTNYTPHSGDIIVLVNSGTAPAPIYFKVYSTGEDVPVELVKFTLTGSTSWSYIGSMNNEVLIVDTNSCTVTKDAALDYGGFRGTFFKLETGVNSLVYEGGAVALQIKYSPLFYTY